MSQAAALMKQMTHEEYLALERASDEKHDFVDGMIVAMAGCSNRHDTITSNIVGMLYAALRGGTCQSYTSDMKVHIPATGGDRYPDASIACEPQFLDPTEDVLLNPCVIFEVLSDSTEATDRGKKFHEYRSIPSFKEYVLVSQHRILVEHYARQTNGSWNLQILPAGEKLCLTCAPVEIAIVDLYERVKFPAK